MAIKADKIWMDGELVDFADANVHVLTHTLHYGFGAFEGIRCYERADGRGAIFRLAEHIKRLLESCLICTISVPWTAEQLAKACIDTVNANGFKDCYLRPIVFLGDGEMGLAAMSNRVRVSVIAWEWGSYLGDDGITNGIDAKISSFSRHHINAGMAKGKIIGQYTNSILAKREAMADGYKEAIMLDTNGFISEGTGENVFVVKDGVLYTRPTPRRCSAGSPATPSSSSPRSPGSKSSSAAWPATSSTSPTRSSSLARPQRSRRSARSTAAPSPTASRGRSPRSSRPPTSTTSRAAPTTTRSGSLTSEATRRAHHEHAHAPSPGRHAT